MTLLVEVNSEFSVQGEYAGNFLNCSKLPTLSEAQSNEHLK